MTTSGQPVDQSSQGFEIVPLAISTTEVVQEALNAIGSKGIANETTQSPLIVSCGSG